MANYYEFPEEFPILCLIHDIAQQQIENDGDLDTKFIKTDEIEISEYIEDEFGIKINPTDIKEIKIYIKAKKNIQHGRKKHFKYMKNIKDILELEIEIIKSNIRRKNKIIKF